MEIQREHLWWAVAINVLITIVQIVGGVLSGSLALLSDALHNFGDAVALFVSGVAYRIGKKPHTTTFTFGYKRAEIIAAMVNASALVVLGILLIVEAVRRFMSPEVPSGLLMVILGIFGLLANGGGVLLLHPHIRQNMNFRSAYLHLLSDAVSSVAIILGGIAIGVWNVSWIDPVLTLLIACYVIWESYDIIQSSVKILMMAAPSELSLEDISQSIATLPNVKNVHHAHLWQMSDVDVHFEAHVCVPDMRISEVQQLLTSIETLLMEKYAIKHVTIQFEYDKCSSLTLLHSTVQNNG